MDAIMSQLLVGAGASAAFQVSKADSWSRWLTVLLAVGVSFGTGYTTGGLDGGLVAAAAALGTHSTVFAGTKMGDAMKLNLLPRIVGVAVQVLTAFQQGMANGQKPPTPPNG